MRIHLWSCPRCVSTSLMYAFSSHPNCEKVIDEPLYANYVRVTESERPYKELLLQNQNSNGVEVVKYLNSISTKKSNFVFIKHIAKMIIGVENIKQLFEDENNIHIFLIRHPVHILKSWSKVLGINQTNLRESAFLQMMEVLSWINNSDPVIIESDCLVKDPELVLSAVCRKIGIEFNAKMLSWPSGPKDFDGIWAPWWYTQTHKSTSFHSDFKKSKQLEPFPFNLIEILNQCLPFYQYLYRKSELLFDFSEAIQPDQIVEEKRGTHEYEASKLNETILIGMRVGPTSQKRFVYDKLSSNKLTFVPRTYAQVSVFDSSFLLGDGIWEGIRLYRGVLLFAYEHIERLFQGMRGIKMDNVDFSPQQILDWIYDTIDINEMGIEYNTHDLKVDVEPVHIRLIVSRGNKPTPYQNPKTTIGFPTVIIIPEYKHINNITLSKGIRLSTSFIRRSRPDTQDPMWNSTSKLNCISACITANESLVEEAIMLDPNGFVATCNSTNFFIVKRGDRDWNYDYVTQNGEKKLKFNRKIEIWTPTAKYQLHGVTRNIIIRICREKDITLIEKDFTLTDVYDAQEAFVTGTFAGQIPVVSVDGRPIGNGKPGNITELLQTYYKELIEMEAERGRDILLDF